MKLRTLAIVLPLSAFAAIAAAQAQPKQPPAPAAPVQQAQPAQPPTVTSVLDRALTQAELEVVGAADAMPEDKYSFAPANGEFTGVRNFAEQVKHVAATNYVIFNVILGEPVPADARDEKGPAPMKTKAEIMKYLRDSFALAHRAVAGITEQNLVAPIANPLGTRSVTRLAWVLMDIRHFGDHYGQMVEYLRMNGIVPPASRPR